MESSIIFCEGKTDAILLSYYLNRVFGWEHLKRVPLLIRVNNDNEYIFWYKNSDNHLAIYACGGKDNIKNNLYRIVYQINTSPNDFYFSKVVLMIDHDNNEINSLKKDMESWLRFSKIKLKDKIEIGKWQEGKLLLSGIVSPSFSLKMKILTIIIPENKKGNLEVFLLDALRLESENYANLVVEAKNYIDKVKDNPELPLLKKEKNRRKAQLQSILSVFSPEWVFYQIDERLKKIKWEKLSQINQIYHELSKL